MECFSRLASYNKILPERYLLFGFLSGNIINWCVLVVNNPLPNFREVDLTFVTVKSEYPTARFNSGLVRVSPDSECENIFC